MAAVALVVVSVAVCVLSLTTGTPHTVGSLMVPKFPPPSPWDKLLHMFAYIVLTGLALIQVPRRLSRQIAAAAVVAAAAGLLEAAQTAIPERTASVADGVANVVGALIGLMIARRWLGRREAQWLKQREQAARRS